MPTTQVSYLSKRRWLIASAVTAVALAAILLPNLWADTEPTFGASPAPLAKWVLEAPAGTSLAVTMTAKYIARGAHAECGKVPRILGIPQASARARTKYLTLTPDTQGASTFSFSAPAPLPSKCSWALVDFSPRMTVDGHGAGLLQVNLPRYAGTTQFDLTCVETGFNGRLACFPPSARAPVSVYSLKLNLTLY